MATKKKKDVFERPESKKLGQAVPKSIDKLLGPGEGEGAPETEELEAEEAASPEPPQPPPKKKKSEAREKFSLSYKAGYKTRLNQLFYREKMNNEKLQKSDLVEEALDMLFEKYGG